MSQNAILLRQANARANGTVLSNEGGDVYRVDPLTHLRRFLILGSTGTFYATGYDVTKGADETIQRVIHEQPRAALDMVIEVSRGNLALRIDPAIYVLAALTRSADLAVKREAVEAVAEVCRIGTDLLHWLGYRFADRKSNRTFRRAVSRWFTMRTPDVLALQAVKYDQRDGWSLRDALRLARPTAPSSDHALIFDWIAHPDKRTTFEADLLTDSHASRLFVGYSALRRDDITPEQAAEAITSARLPREMVPGPLLGHEAVWRALLPDMPGRALLRNLGKLSSLGMDDEHSVDLIVRKIHGATKVCHPFEFLLARSVYDAGRGIKGSLTWTPNSRISTALAEGFGEAFTGLEIYPDQTPLIALDVSGSMTYGNASGTHLTCVDAETSLALVFAYQFPNATFMAYENRAYHLEVRGEGYDELRQALGRIQGGGTDCSLPLTAAMSDPEVSAVVSITDS